jgi:DNA-binding GntR family transcriptional regulator
MSAPDFDAQEQEPVEETSTYKLIREDILSGRLAASERLKVGALATRYNTSTNPVREALQQLRGEGFVVFEHNRGARVRAIDEDFIRNVYEIEVLVEPYMTKWFVGIVTAADIAHLEDIQDQIETLAFRDRDLNNELDMQFHRVFYDRHYNRNAFDMWWKHREILRAVSRSYPLSLTRSAAILSEHRALIAALKTQDAEAAANVIAAHVRGSGQHVIEQMRAARPKAS